MRKKINVRDIGYNQKILFLASGAFQYLLDVAIFSILILFLSNSLLANAIAKVSVGLSGFWVNGVWVFKTLRKISKREIFFSFIKFLVLLSFMTILSNYLVCLYEGDNYQLKVAVKMASEILLAVLSFLIQKFFVYKESVSESIGSS